MLSTLSRVTILMRKALAVGQFASEFSQGGNTTPMIHEALCYSCMLGIVTTIHHDAAPKEA
ncbi:hypothetical protein AWB81_00373 [Caballeronia arationis]|jgi:hypothetical protein|uniref:Uncharacterized protein n=1 Tax=Caballeronia arationis TaxID=1777142 RepID=A0A7Z7N645_9BURK|nr:hypothetical protein [Caballeronia arationis]SAK45369.1 hypothetical protein AWB81_00373 [Caballeronia arationis]SOE88420.1 hypothetical protein SAMN05446927_7031 [Caballeronia arationis]